ncbi:MAG: YbhB/YbcL family Raf kinase inhibitor-like protein [Acidobacteriota bacterium]
MSLALKIVAFANGGEIPSRYTCGGADISPALAWSGVSPAARSLALIVDDPDAPRGTWTHWLMWNLPPYTTMLPERVPPREVLDNGARQGRNDFDRIGYGGPCPPAGKTHRYFFRLLVLDAMLDLQAAARRKEVDRAMKGHILAEVQWMGLYGNNNGGSGRPR